MTWWTPARRRALEILDDPAIPNDVRERAVRDIGWSNVLFGGTRSVRRAADDVLRRGASRLVLLDVGTGLADIPAALRVLAANRGVDLFCIGIDLSDALALRARSRLDAALVADARCLPFRDGSVDVVTCSQLLHHFGEEDATHVLRELNRVSRMWVIVSDLYRSWLAAAGFWLASLVLRFHPVTRADGFTSVLRGFTPFELSGLVAQATGAHPRIRSGLFWRLSASWRAGTTDGGPGKPGAVSLH